MQCIGTMARSAAAAAKKETAKATAKAKAKQNAKAKVKATALRAAARAAKGKPTAKAPPPQAPPPLQDEEGEYKWHDCEEEEEEEEAVVPDFPAQVKDEVGFLDLGPRPFAMVAPRVGIIYTCCARRATRNKQHSISRGHS